MDKTKIQEWYEAWENTTWRCKETGEQITITPEMVKRRAFYSFGNSFVDLGDEYYSRMGGYPEQVL